MRARAGAKRLATFGVGGVLVLALLAGAGCAKDDPFGCGRPQTDDIEAALRALHKVTEKDVKGTNLDQRLEGLGNDVNKVMNTTDDANGLALRDLKIKYNDVRDQLERLGTTQNLTETGKELRKTMRMLGDAIRRFSDATDKNCKAAKQK